jgi:hypothetical protein
MSAKRLIFNVASTNTTPARAPTRRSIFRGNASPPSGSLTDEKSGAFEQYLKQGSGHAFANRHFW